MDHKAFDAGMKTTDVLSNSLPNGVMFSKETLVEQIKPTVTEEYWFERRDISIWIALSETMRIPMQGTKLRVCHLNGSRTNYIFLNGNWMEEMKLVKLVNILMIVIFFKILALFSHYRPIRIPTQKTRTLNFQWNKLLQVIGLRFRLRWRNRTFFWRKMSCKIMEI